MKSLPRYSPFKLLRSYEKDDVSLFFGRERETRKLYNALLSSKFMLVYGASGTGKTSLIQCGLQGMYSPRDWMPILIRRRGNFLDAIREELEQRYRERFADYRAQQLQWYPDEPAPEPQSFDDLRDLIRELFNISYVPIYLILDQFEEVFTLGDRKEQDTFFEELNSLDLFAEDLFCKILLVTREEYIAHFYRYEYQLPFLFENRFRVEKMREEQLLSVVNGTLTAPYEGYPSFEVEAGTPKQILENVADKRGEVDLTTLQVYLDRLYQEDINRLQDRDYIRFDSQLVGDHKLEHIISDFLDQQVRQITTKLQQQFPEEKVATSHNIPLQVLFQLVTNEGTKQSGSTTEIQQQLKQGKILAPIGIIEACLAAFAAPDSRILNRLNFAKHSEEHYEIMHDRLAEQIHNKFSGEERRRRESITTIRNKYNRFQGAERPKEQKQEYLSIGEIELIDQSLNFDALREEEKHLGQFFKASQQYHTAKKRRAALGLAIAIMAAAVFLAVAIFAVQANFRAIKERNSAIANELASRSFLELNNNNDATLALELAKTGLEADSTSVSARKALFSAFYQDPEGVRNPFYRELDQAVLPIRHSRFTPSGSHIVTQSDSVVQIWDRHGKLIQSLMAEDSEILAMDISSDDRFIALLYEDQTCSIYDWKESSDEPFFETNQAVFVDLAFHPATHEITLISTDEIFRVDITNKQVEKIADNPEEMFDVIYHPEGDQLITVQTGPSISLWNLSNLELIDNIPLFGKKPVKIDFSPNGDFVVTAATRIGEIRHKDGTLKQEIAHRGREVINSAKFSPSGRYVVTAGLESVILQDLEEGDSLELTGHIGRIYGTSFTTKDDQFLTYSEDGRVKVWSFTGEQKYELVGITDKIVDEAMFSSNGMEIIMQIKDSIPRLFDLRLPQKELVGHSNMVTDVVIIPDQEVIVTSSQDSTAIFWSKEGTYLSSISADEGITHLCLSKDGKSLVVASNNGAIAFWDVSDVRNPERWQLLHDHDYNVNAIGFSKSERYFVSIGQDGKTALYPIDLGAKVISSFIPIEADSTEVSAFAFSTDDQILLVGNGLGGIKVWKLEGEKERSTLTLERAIEAATDRINSISLTEDNQTFWASSYDGTMKSWDFFGKVLKEIRNDYGIGNPILTHPDYVIAPGYFGHLITTNLESGITNFVPTDEQEILDWSFDQDRDLLITAAGESAKIWLFDEQHVQLDLLAELKGHTAAILAIAVSDQSDFLVTVSLDQKVVVWPITPASLLESRELKK